MTKTVTGRRAAGTALGFLALAGIVILIGASSASAQGQPAICDQYPDLPECVGPGGGGDGGDIGTGGLGGEQGELPFTGYPLSPLLLVLLVLLAGGLVLRSSLAIRSRIQARRGAV